MTIQRPIDSDAAIVSCQVPAHLHTDYFSCLASTFAFDRLKTPHAIGFIALAYSNAIVLLQLSRSLGDAVLF